VRVVFDPGMKPADYAPALKQIQTVADVMGEPIDSAFPSGTMSVSQYTSRMNMFMKGSSNLVNIWEIGNEVNGDWTCASPTMATKLSSSYTIAHSLGLKTAITLYYSDWYLGSDREMVAWSKKYLSAKVLNGVDYVLVSFYPTFALGPHPNWSTIFANLAKVYPNAQVGFGELGMSTLLGDLSWDVVQKKQLFERYYTMKPPIPNRFVNGFFWWTWAEDILPGSGNLNRQFSLYLP